MFPMPKEKLPVPFHISMIKSAMKRQEGEFESIHFEFHAPNEKTRKDSTKLEFPGGVSCLKQLSYKSRDSGKIAVLINKVKEMQKNFKLRKPVEEVQKKKI
jgi:nucleosome binding factor SPN SPT16 subunit